MRPGRELDTAIAEQVFNRRVFVKKRILFEETPEGDRPLRHYSKQIEAAWEIIEKLNISLIPIENGSWFALIGKERGWDSPADFISFLQTGNFVNAGAGVADTAPLAVCLAAIKALEGRKAAATLEAQNSKQQHH